MAGDDVRRLGNDEQITEDLQRLRSHYDALVQRYGASPEGAQYSDRETHERRFAVLAEVGDLTNAKVLDFGCGTGGLLEYLRTRRGFDGEYVGYDMSPAAIEHARQRFPDYRFELQDPGDPDPAEEFDYVFVGGVFNNRISDNWSLFTHWLPPLFRAARRALAFNALSNYVDYMEPELFYANPLEVFDLCKSELSPCVTLRHDYKLKDDAPPYEFTIYVYEPGPHSADTTLQS